MDDFPEEEMQEDIEIFDDEENLEDPQNLPVETNQEDLEDENKDDNEKKQVKPKRVIKNPRVTLNAERLKGPKGLGVLEGCFEKIKFKGKGHEDDDLNVLLKTYEYWCHRLFPKFSFQDSIEKIEKLGYKGPIQTHLKKIRSGMVEDEQSTSAVVPEFRSDEEYETERVAASQIASQTIIEDIPIKLTEEQMETIRQNRLKAEKLRQERLKKIQDKAALHMPERSCGEEPPIAGTSTDTVEEEMESLESTINMLQETTRQVSKHRDHSSIASGEDIQKPSRTTTQNSEESLNARDDADQVEDEINSKQSGKCELYNRNCEENCVKNRDNSSLEEKDKENEINSNRTREITGDKTSSQTQNEH